jgi:hypothetical protein
MVTVKTHEQSSSDEAPAKANPRVGKPGHVLAQLDWPATDAKRPGVQSEQRVVGFVSASSLPGAHAEHPNDVAFAIVNSVPFGHAVILQL